MKYLILPANGLRRFTLSAFRGVLILLVAFVPLSDLAAQDNALDRLSVAERSDGQGYVVRFHLDEEADSFKVFQPAADLIQMTLYGDRIDTAGVEYHKDSPVYEDVSFYTIPDGIGIDIYVKEGRYFRAELYPDAHTNDLLMGLTNSSEEDLELLTEGLDPVIWSTFSVSQESLLVGGALPEENGTVFDSTYQQVKSKLKFDVVVIDAGHGGHDSGAIGYKNTKEKDVVLAIAKKVGGYIKEHLPDVRVVYTREDDSFKTLKDRGVMANKVEADLFISIHTNAFKRNRNVRGAEVYFLGLAKSDSAMAVTKRENSVVNLENNGGKKKELTDEELMIYELANSGFMSSSEKIAGMIEHQLDERAQRRSRGVKQGPFVVLWYPSMPSILVETGFITNPGEQRYLTSEYGQSIIASAIFRAIRNYKNEYDKSQNFNTN